VSLPVGEPVELLLVVAVPVSENLPGAPLKKLLVKLDFPPPSV